MSQDTVEVYVVLLEEGTDTIRGTQAVNLGNGLVQLLPTPWYDPEDEVWEFPPGSIVKIKSEKDYLGNSIMLAYAKA
ncbi:MAG: hypothetical protein JNN09_06010 [Alphaproteobacteria bacterium]|nr:hypothetical protein [Alphaproteobacteria bacterium]